MFDEISTIVVQAILAVIALFVYVYLVSSLYPWLTMRLVCRRRVWGGRGVRRVTFPEGRGVVYEPDVRVRRYIPQYAVLVRDGHKFLQCRVDARVAFMRYDVVSFDRYGRMLDLVGVSEMIVKRGHTQPVVLPTETAYAYIVPRRVDGMFTDKVKIARYSWPGRILCAGLTVLTTLVVAAVLYGGLVPLLRFIWPNVIAPSRGLFFLAAFGLGVVTSAWIFFIYHMRSKRVINR